MNVCPAGFAGPAPPLPGLADAGAFPTPPTSHQSLIRATQQADEGLTAHDVEFLGQMLRDCRLGDGKSAESFPKAYLPLA